MKLSSGSEDRCAKGRRRITPEAGRALKLLAHAIEHLTDDLVRDGADSPWNQDRIKAIKKLMELNREVYLECPLVPTLAQRFQKWMDRMFGSGTRIRNVF